MVASFFLYGTLMRGESRHAAIEAHRPECIVPATCRGRLVDLGDYPGLVDAAGTSSVVHGELVRFPEDALAGAVARLDAIEGFLGDGIPGSLYVRRLVTVTRDDGHASSAWTYVYAGDLGRARPIHSGSWRVHRRRA